MKFKFEIGSFVRLLASERQHFSDRWRVTFHKEMRGQILSRSLEECPGGIQEHYSIRWITRQGDFLDKAILHNVIELVASEPFPSNEDTEESRDK